MKTDYQLHRGAALDEEVRRIVHGLADEALDLLERREPNEIANVVHSTRKRCKEARGLLRLVRPALGGQYQKGNRLFTPRGAGARPHP